MAASASLLLLVLLFGTVAAEGADLCVDQPESINVQINDSVDLPCTYSFTGQQSTVANVIVNWRSGPGDRCGNSSLIYNGTNNNTRGNYNSRLTLLEDLKQGRGGAIRIHGLTASDIELKYCCRINITLKNGTAIISQNKLMTKLVLADSPAQNSVAQVDVIPALVGESVNIPCRFTYQKTLNTSNDVTVRWTAGKREGCLDLKEDTSNRYKLEMGNGIISLQIAKLRAADSKRYCCHVMLNGSTEIQSSRGTNLIVGDLKSMEGYSVTQKEHITAQINETVKLNCDFKHPSNRMPVWIGVYLTVEDKLEKFAYHPDQDFIQPEFRGRTHLIRDHKLGSNVSFQIDNVTEKDNKNYYCLVAFRFCYRSNTFYSVIQRGGGTLLILNDLPGPSLAIIFTAAAIALLLILIVVLLLKRKGVICARSAPAQKQLRKLADPSKDSHQTDAEMSRANISTKVVDSVVYATLDLNDDKKEDARDWKPSLQNDILYSTVKLT